MSYFNRKQIPLAGFADIFKGGGTDFQSILNASLFDLGTASNEDLTRTTAAPANGPSTPLGADAERPALPTINGVTFGQGYEISDANRFNIDLAKALQPDDSKYDQKLEKLRAAMREEAEYANKMGRQNALLGFALKDLPKFMAAPARAAATYDNLNAQAPYFAAQSSRRYFS